MAKAKRSKLLVSLCFSLWLGGSHEASIDVGDWTFATDLEGWRLGDNVTTEAYNSSSLDWKHPCNLNEVTGTWKGGMTCTPFVYPAYPNAAKDDENYGILSAKVFSAKVCAIYVVKIPKDRNQQNLNKILTDATRIPIMCVEWDNKKDINFKDRPAHHLAEGVGITKAQEPSRYFWLMIR